MEHHDIYRKYNICAIISSYKSEIAITIWSKVCSICIYHSHKMHHVLHLWIFLIVFSREKSKVKFQFAINRISQWIWLCSFEITQQVNLCKPKTANGSTNNPSMKHNELKTPIANNLWICSKHFNKKKLNYTVRGNYLLERATSKDLL